MNQEFLVVKLKSLPMGQLRFCLHLASVVCKKKLFTFQSSHSKLLFQMKPNLVGMVFGRSLYWYNVAKTWRPIRQFYLLAHLTELINLPSWSHLVWTCILLYAWVPSLHPITPGNPFIHKTQVLFPSFFLQWATL